jgi:hypothetical protein
MDWDALTAIGTLALAAMTFAAVVVTIVITTQDRRRADERSRRERLWSDAELVSDVEQLLVDLDPERRGLNANPGTAEEEMWASLFRRTGLTEARLRTVAISHPSEHVQAKAKALPRKLWSDYTQSRAHVSEVLRSGGNLDTTLADAKSAHQSAAGALAELEAAITSAGQPVVSATVKWFRIRLRSRRSS